MYKQLAQKQNCLLVSVAIAPGYLQLGTTHAVNA